MSATPEQVSAFDAAAAQACADILRIEARVERRRNALRIARTAIGAMLMVLAFAWAFARVYAAAERDYHEIYDQPKAGPSVADLIGTPSRGSGETRHDFSPLPQSKLILGGPLR